MWNLERMMQRLVRRVSGTERPCFLAGSQRQTPRNYPGYDRFGGIKDQFWDGYNMADVDRFKYAVV